jgi:hypothetical protein
MKNLFIAFNVLLICTCQIDAFAQYASPIIAATQAEANDALQAGIVARSSQSGGGNILFSEDFSNGFDGINGNGEWTAADNGNNNIWIYVAPGNTGYYANGASTGVTHPAGEFSSNIGPLESGTPENGWMIFDCDYYNTPISEGYQDTDGSLTSPVIDFSNNGSVILSWDQYFRYCCYPYAPIYVDVTNDGGASWTTFDGHGAFIEAANSASANPLPTTLDISCVAAYNDSVQFRFTYTQAPETGNGYSHYYWGIDDVVVSSNDNADDLAMVQLTNGDLWNVWEYRVTPMEQAIPASDGGVVAGVLYRNNGNENQTDVEVLVEILNESGDVVLASVTETIPTVYSFANGTNCPANSQDTLYIATGWEPSVIGNYILRSTLTSGSSNDLTPEDNTMSKVIVYSDDEYGHDDEAALDGEMFPRESDIGGLYDPSGQGCFYHMVNSGSTAYGITVDFGENCGLAIDGHPAELEFESRLYFYDSTVGITDSPFESAFWSYDTTWSNAGPKYLPFDYPIELDADAVYFAGVIAEYESEGGLTVNAQLNSDTDNSTGEYNSTGAGDYVWFTSQTYTPAIRLILNEGAFSGCTDTSACNYDSNANTDDGSCVFPEQWYDCYGECISDVDNDAICDELEILGCTDYEAYNYNSEATDSDNTLCIYFVPDCNSFGDPGWLDTESGAYPEQSSGVFGEMYNEDIALHLSTTIVEPSSGVSYTLAHFDFTSMSGLPQGLISTMTGGQMNPNSEVCVNVSGIPIETGVFDILFTGEAYINVFGNSTYAGVISFIHTIEIGDNPNPISGCTYPGSDNYLLYAMVDDGTCIISGCTDPEASNFHPIFNLENGSCQYVEDISDCIEDLNQDGTIGTPDLLQLLSAFGLTCE